MQQSSAFLHSKFTGAELAGMISVVEGACVEP